MKFIKYLKLKGEEMNKLTRLNFYIGNYKRMLYLSIILSAFSTIGLLLPYYSIYKIFMDIANNRVIDGFFYGGIAIIGVVIGTISYFFSLLASHKVAFGVERNMRQFGVNKLMDVELSYFDNNETGKVRKIIDDNAAKTHGFIAHNLPDIVAVIISPIIIIIALFFINWMMATLMIIIIISSFFMIILMVGDSKNMSKYMNSLNRMVSEGTEYIRGMQVVKIFNTTYEAFLDFKKSIQDYSDWVTKYAFSARRPLVINQILLNIIGLLLIAITYPILIHSTDTHNFIFIVMFTMIISGQIVIFLTKVMTTSENISMTFHVIGELEDIFKGYQEHTQDNKDLNFQDYSIELKDVSFSYNQRDLILNQINMKVPSKGMVAIVGPSGSGKSTLAKLISKMYLKYEGEIYIGENELRTVSESEYLNHVTYVFQSNKLYSKTIYENLLMANPDATEKEILEVIKESQCDDIIAKLPDGINTKIGNKGVYLSGGEIQRLVLCRAMLRNTQIIILDEITASVDPENEYKIQLALKKLIQNKTVIMIAHKLALIKQANQIIVMNDGRIVERGKHKQLMASKQLYYRMYKTYQKAKSWKLGDQHD